MYKELAGKRYTDENVSGIIVGYCRDDKEVLLLLDDDYREKAYMIIDSYGWGNTVDLGQSWEGKKPVYWVRDFKLENVELDFSGISTVVLKRVANCYKEDGSACMGISCGEGICPFENKSTCFAVDDFEGRHKAFKKELERRENKVNEMPKLEAGMVVKDEDNNYSILLPSSNTEGKFLFTMRDGDNRSTKLGAKDIVEIRKIKKGKNYYPFFTSGNFITYSDIIWKKEPNKKQLLQEKLDKLQEEYNKAVEEIKRELDGIN